MVKSKDKIWHQLPASEVTRFLDVNLSTGLSAEDIKLVFRKRARVFHSDVAKDKVAGETKFKEINEVYEVLSDPEKRRRYDELGPNWQDGGNGASAQERIEMAHEDFDFWQLRHGVQGRGESG